MRELAIAIVGGGPAGLSTALFLAHYRPELADRIAVLERERYPRDKYCAGALGGRADKLLATIGVRADVPSVPIHAMSAAFARGRITVREPDIGRVVRRIELDHAMALAARARGLRVLEGVSVEAVAWEPGGAVLQTSDGPVRARVVVGADGVGSVVRRAMGLPFGRVRAQVVEVDTEPTPRDDPGRDTLHFDFSLQDVAGYTWDFPTLAGGESLVCRGAYVLTTSPPREADPKNPGAARAPAPNAADPKELLRAHCRALGLDLDRYRLKRYAERGFDPSIRLSRPGALLAGEAAGIDPMLGEGIPQAIDYGALAGRFLADQFDPAKHPSGSALPDLAGWNDAIRASRLGLDLRARAAFFERYYRSPLRDPFERYVVTGPAFLGAVLRYFGGKPVPRPDKLRALASAALFVPRAGLPALLREAARAALRRARSSRFSR